ncbi:MAG: hypothetical protein WBO43_13090, partial [Gemmatimonadota bacterium]
MARLTVLVLALAPVVLEAEFPTPYPLSREALVGKRYNLTDTAPWGSTAPRSEIVLVASTDGIDRDELQHAFD